MIEVCEILSLGAGLSFQDQGRVGWAQFGVPYAGALDRYSARIANQLVGNNLNEPVLEILMGGVALKFLSDTWVAVSGADFNSQILPWSARLVEKGEVLKFHGGNSGVASYLAVKGGFFAPRFMGSCSPDSRSGIGSVLVKG